jgi:hypothetical protein
MKQTYRVIPMQSWGNLPQNMQDTWRTKRCDIVFTVMRMEKHAVSSCVNKTATANKDHQSSKSKDPLIAVMAGTTSRKVLNPSTKTMSLFNYLLPSLVRSLDCGFRYVFVLGYDAGDPFYDTEEVCSPMPYTVIIDVECTRV